MPQTQCRVGECLICNDDDSLNTRISVYDDDDYGDVYDDDDASNGNPSRLWAMTIQMMMPMMARMMVMMMDMMPKMMMMLMTKMLMMIIYLSIQIVGDSEGRKIVPSFAGDINIGPVGEYHQPSSQCQHPPGKASFEEEKKKQENGHCSDRPSPINLINVLPI